MSSSESISSSDSISGTGLMRSIRSWIFGILTLGGAGVLLYTWFQPWWQAYIEELQQNGVVIFPHAMQISGTLRNYPQWLVGAEMPSWFFPLMWVYLGVCLIALFMSLFFTEEWVGVGKRQFSLAQLLIGFAGLAYIIFVVVFPIVISMRAPDFHGVPLQGSVFISMNEHTESFVVSTLQPGYWIACVVGPFLLALALFRDKIIGKP
jgi:hypothetical protein